MKYKDIFIIFLFMINIILYSVMILKFIELDDKVSIIRVKPIVDELDSIRENSAAVFQSNIKMMNCLNEHVISCDKSPHHDPKLYPVDTVVNETETF